MTREAVKATLHRYLSIKNEFLQVQRHLQQFESLMYSPSGVRMDGMPRGSGGGDPVSRLVEEHEALVDKYKTRLAELAAAQKRIEDLIDTLDPRARKLIRHRYVEGMTWEKVCVEMSYCWRQTHNIHSEALDQLAANSEKD